VYECWLDLLRKLFARSKQWVPKLLPNTAKTSSNGVVRHQHTMPNPTSEVFIGNETLAYFTWLFASEQAKGPKEYCTRVLEGFVDVHAERTATRESYYFS